MELASFTARSEAARGVKEEGAGRQNVDARPEQRCFG
jgi:hypothetical protein